MIDNHWYKNLTKEELSLIEELIEADFKILKVSETKGKSYFILKKELSRLKKKIIKYTEHTTDFKIYLDYLVEQDILAPSIALIIYEKHKKELMEEK